METRPEKETRMETRMALTHLMRDGGLAIWAPAGHATADATVYHQKEPCRCPWCCRRASGSAKSASTVQPQTVLAGQLSSSAVPRAAAHTGAVRPVTRLR